MARALELLLIDSSADGRLERGETRIKRGIDDLLCFAHFVQLPRASFDTWKLH